jgi:flagellar biosynthesis protein FlhG
MSSIAAETKVVSITSGKGGVGKTTLTSNLAYELWKRGHKVLLLDGDFGMSNIEVMFKAKPQNSLYDVLFKGYSLEEVICPLDDGLDLISGGSGLYEMSKLTMEQKRQVLMEISGLQSHYDYMIVDTAPGYSEQVLYLNSAAHKICVVVTPDPSSFTDSYALIKLLHQKMRIQNFDVICNMVKNEAEGKALYQRFSDVVQRFLYVRLGYLGCVPRDEQLSESVKHQRLICKEKGSNQASVSIRDIAQSVAKEFAGDRREIKVSGGIQVFWSQVLQMA